LGLFVCNLALKSEPGLTERKKLQWDIQALKTALEKTRHELMEVNKACNTSEITYLTMVVARAGLLITIEGNHVHKVLARTIDIAQVSDLVLSLLTNDIATSITAIKSWCVHVIFKLDWILC